MKKVEWVWRELLIEASEGRDHLLTQQELAIRLGISVSTVFAALRLPRKAHAIAVKGNGFTLRDPGKILYLWASYRDLKPDLLYRTRVDLPVREIEGAMPDSVVFGGYSAFRLTFGEPPSDYDSVTIYGKTADPLIRRFPPKKGPPNLFLLRSDPGLARFGKVTPPVQTFVDIWNFPEWYARDFLNALKEKLHGLLA